MRGSCGKGYASNAGCCGRAGVIALGAYGFVATFQPDPNFGRVLAAYGGIFVSGSLLWGVVADSFGRTDGISREPPYASMGSR